MRLKYLFGEFELNPASRELLRNGRPVSLRPKSLECLVYLIEHRDRAVGRDELISAVWGRVDVGDAVVAQTLLRARKALDDTGNQQGMIRTVPRFGYRWVAPVQVTTISTDAEPASGDEPDDASRPVASETGVSDADATAPRIADEGQATMGAADLPAEPGGTISPAASPPRRFRHLAWPALLVLLAAVGIGIYYLRLPGKAGPASPPLAPTAADTALVMPVALVSMDSESAWIRLGAMDYMAARLRSSGINVMPSEQALRVDAAIEGDAPAEARKELAALSGARWVVLPQAQREGGEWRVRLRVLEAGKEQQIEARGASALSAAAEATDAWLRQMGGTGAIGPPPGGLAERLHRIDAELLASHLSEARLLVRSASVAERRDPRLLLREAKLELRSAHLDAASNYFQAALQQSPASDLETRVGALVGLGTVEQVRHNLDAAEQRFTQALEILESMQPDRVNSRMLGVVLQGRGVVRVQRGDLDAGVKDMGQARIWLQRSGDLITLGAVGHNLGKTELLRGNYLQALSEFDRSIETFERYRVDDFLTNSLQEKAEVQLMLARVSAAWTTILRADALLPKLEDDDLARDTLATKARIQLALGQLAGADDTLARLRARGAPENEPRLQELRLRLLLARGKFAEARRLAQSGPPARDLDGGLILAAVQAALRGGDIALAERWLIGEAPPEEPAAERAVSLTLARALIAHAAGQDAAAERLSEQARAGVRARPAPELEIRAGIEQAGRLLDRHQYAAASAILGELEKYADADYRVAWSMSALYQALNDPVAAATARERTRRLAGERNPAIEPAL